MKTTTNFSLQKPIKISSSRLMFQFLFHETTLGWKKYIHWNEFDFLPIEIVLAEVGWSGIDILLIKVMLKKVRQNDIFFSPFKFSLKKYFEMTYKFVYILFLTNGNDNDIKLTLIPRVVNVGWYVTKDRERWGNSRIS